MLNFFGELDALPINDYFLPSHANGKTCLKYDTFTNSSQAPYQKRPSSADGSSDGRDDFYGAPSGEVLFSSRQKRVKTEPERLLPMTERLTQIDMKTDEDHFPGDDSFDDIDMDAFMAVVHDVDMKPAASVPEEISEVEHLDEKKPVLWLAVYDSLIVSSEDLFGPLATNTLSIKSFDIDYLEHQVPGFYVVLPRRTWNEPFSFFRAKKSAEQGEAEGWYDTDEVSKLTDVYRSFDAIRSKRDVKKFNGKFVERQFVFGDPNIPKRKLH
ncbi:uncharacterized protein C8R40DRAFT_1068946 [Lentinula edodes]|uniref:uncharacterized protein n=1 Tax=Lentinula edodes TaxID=5353 RepID=UPI001E8EA29F|nr:uncharacterized protein C8R40DRAFT_1068946 [Lentinula edodes]KAH7876168.1 hypothetical protein C8R40DRAFT_1068946 [Lentinula edodes]